MHVSALNAYVCVHLYFDFESYTICFILFLFHFQGQIECDSETVLELAAHVLQACKGDFTR